MADNIKMQSDALKNSVSKLGVRTEICGNRSVTVDGCAGVIDYTDEILRLNAGRMEIAVSGKDLRIAAFTEDSVVVEGLINSVNYSRRR